MHKFFSVAALAVVTMLLAGCGGDSFGGGSGSSSGGGTTGNTSTVATLTVTSSTATIPSDGSAPATITVVAKDANSAVVSGATVAFAASGGNVTATQGTTDSTGTATATLVANSVTPATITVTASNGSASGQTTVAVANAQKTMTLLTSIPQIPSDGSTSATISAIVRDANNNFVTGDTVNFSASSGGLLVSQAKTDTAGTATATLSSAGDTSNRTITITATDGVTKATVTVGVAGTKLNVSGPATLIQGATGTFTISLVDAGGNGIANQTVTLTSSAGNTLTPATFTTDSTGQKSFTLTATNAGNDTVTAVAAGLTATATLAVSNQNFAFTAPAVNTKVNLGVSQALTLTWLSGATPQANQTVNFSATRGTLTASTGMTDANGQVQVSITSTQSGPSVITATATGVSAQTSLDFVATNPTQIKAQASPATIQTLSPSTITVTVRDPADNLVEGKTVNFSITKDVTGGTLSVSSATTNVQGQASTVYTAGSTTSAANGVVITATVAGTSVTSTTSLTVAGQTVDLVLGTTNQIAPYIPAGSPTGTIATQYKLPYSVSAVDNTGAGINAVPITVTVTSLGYGKGKWLSGTPWTQQYTTSQPPYTSTPADTDEIVVQGYAGCLSEDVNNDGILIPKTQTGTNDYNNNDQLDPGLIAHTDISKVTTAADGSAVFNLIYPQDHARWVAVRLTVTATVSGTESSRHSDFWLPILAADIATANVSPPGQFSPYGLATTCKVSN